ncbi:MAG: MFS transporter [bacterium]|nr:MFS transporter [bacterium]
MRRPRDGVEVPRRAWVVLAVVCISIFLVVIDASIVNVAFPTIGADLNTTDATLSWILTAYNVTVASLLLLAGRTADRLGRKRVFLVSVAVFTVASLLCSLAPTAGSLIGFRVLKAVGGSAIFPSSLALVLTEFPVERRSAAVGIWSAVAGFGGAVGPSAGALLIELFGWRGIFWATVPFGAAVVVLGRRYLTETRVANDDGRLDVIGVPVSVLGVALVLLAVVQAEHWGYTSARTITLAGVGLVLLPFLVWRSRRHPSPVLDLSLFGIRSFRVATFATLFFGCAFLGGFFLNSLLLQRLWDWPVWKTGLGLSPSPLMSVVASWWVGRAADRLGHRWLTAAGSGLCVAAFAWQFWRVGAVADYVSDFLPSMLMLGAGAGMAITCITAAPLADLGSDQFAMGNATARTVQQLCYGVGVAAVVALLGAGGAADLARYPYAWIWLICAYGLAGLTMALFYPSGSAAGRAADGAGATDTASPTGRTRNRQG